MKKLTLKKLTLAIFLMTATLWSCDENSVNNDDDPCAEQTCNDHGTCDQNQEEAFCECEQGYIWDGNNKLSCVLPPDNCEGVTCNQNGTCLLDANNDPSCECDEGYMWDGENNLSCVPENVDYKPVIYLYPQRETKVTVEFAQPENVELLYTYPQYGPEGWCVNAQPDGTLYGCSDNQEYYALFWEGITPDNFNKEEGFVVKGKEIVNFLEEKLPLLGLNRREANEFIIFWQPILEGNPYNFISFAQKSWIQSVPLKVQPAPTTTIRFLMLYTPLNFPINVKPQKLIPPARKGFVLVEWGGRKVTL